MQHVRKSSGRCRFLYERRPRAVNTPPDPNLIVTLGSDDENQEAPSNDTPNPSSTSPSSRIPKSRKFTSLNALAAHAEAENAKRKGSGAISGADSQDPPAKRPRLPLDQANEGTSRAYEDNLRRRAMDMQMGDDDDIDDLQQDVDDQEVEEDPVITLYKNARREQLRERHKLQWDMLNNTLARIKQCTYAACGEGAGSTGHIGVEWLCQ